MLRPVAHFAPFALLFAVMTLGLTACSAAGTSNTPAAGVTPAAAAPGAWQFNLAISPEPPTAGPATFTVDLRDAQGNPVDGAQVTLSAKHSSMMHPGPSGTLNGQGGGKYSGQGDFSMAGQWQVSVTAAAAGANPVTKEFAVAVQ